MESRTGVACPVLSSEPAAAPDTEPRHVGWACKWDTSVLWQGCCCLWLLCWLPRDRGAEPVEPCCLLGQSLRGCQSLPTLNAPACRASWLPPGSKQSVRQLLRSLAGQGTHLWGHPTPWVSLTVLTSPVLSRERLEAAGIHVCRWATLPEQWDLPPHTMLKQCCQLCIIHKSSAVFCYSVIITSFIMAHISQQLYSLQNHHGKMGNNDILLLFHCDLVGLGTQCNTDHLGSSGRWMAMCQGVLWKAQPRWLCLLKSIQKPQLQSVKSNKHANYFKTNFN